MRELFCKEAVVSVIFATLRWIQVRDPGTSIGSLVTHSLHGFWGDVTRLCALPHTTHHTTTVLPVLMLLLSPAGHKAWAFGLGLERLAMVLFDIPDIRWVVCGGYVSVRRGGQGWCWCWW
jgi:hypothetical protein